MLRSFSNRAAPLDVIEPELLRVHELLWRLGDADGAFLHDLVRGVLDRPIDTYRPAAAILVAAATREYVPQFIIQFAAAVQIVHAASFAHQFAGWAEPDYAPSLDDRLAVLAGDYLYAQAAVLTAGLTNLNVMAALAESIKAICRTELAPNRRQRESEHPQLPPLPTAATHAAQLPPIPSAAAPHGSQGLFRLSLWGAAELLNLGPTLQDVLATLGWALDLAGDSSLPQAAGTRTAGASLLAEPALWPAVRQRRYLTALLEMAAEVEASDAPRLR